MRIMSFMHTVQAMRDRTKTVTRRLGWAQTKPGDVYLAVVKARGVAVKDRQVLGRIRVVSVLREPLGALEGTMYLSAAGACGSAVLPYLGERAKRECAREGFPDLDGPGFVKMFCKHMQCKPDAIVNRIEFEHLD